MASIGEAVTQEGGGDKIPLGSRVFIGIDNGISGAIAVVQADRSTAFVVSMPIITHSAHVRKRDKRTGEMVNKTKVSNSYDVQGLVETFALIKSKYVISGVYLEQAQVMQHDGKVSAGKIMVGFGIVQGVLAALGISYSVVAPQTWQSKMIKGVTGVDTKERAFKVAQSLYPKMHDVLSRVKRTGAIEINDGACDAICLADFALREFFSEKDGPKGFQWSISKNKKQTGFCNGKH